MEFFGYFLSKYIRAYTRAHMFTLDEKKITVMVRVSENAKRFYDMCVLRLLKKKKARLGIPPEWPMIPPQLLVHANVQQERHYSREGE